MVRLPFLDGLKKNKGKKEIEEQIKELNKRKAELESSKEDLDNIGRGAGEVQEEIEKVEKGLKEKYDELATIEYKEALEEIEEESEKKKITLSRMKGELKEEKKERKRLEKKLEMLEQDKESLKQDKKQLLEKIDDLEEELRDKKMKIHQKKDIIKEIKEEKTEEKEPQREEPAEKEENTRIKLFETILKKYKDYISDKEKKTIQEMKELIQPNNINLKEYLEEIEEEDNLKACESAYEKIMKEIQSCSPPPVEYWMTIKSMIDNKSAYKKDKAILLCSAFRHFNTEAYVSLVKLENREKRPLIQIKTDEKYLLIDPNKKHGFKRYYGTREELKEQYTYKGNKIRDFNYSFNDKEYITLEGT